jgi:hypothetical protein
VGVVSKVVGEEVDSFGDMFGEGSIISYGAADTST